jgi:hypothetical protein
MQGIGERTHQAQLHGGHATVAVMTFPLQVLALALDERAETWSGLAMSWRTVPAQPNHGKPVVRAELESAAWLVQIMIWSTGEAELETVRLRDERIVNKRFYLTSRSDLDDLLDQLVRLLVHSEVPDAAIVQPDQRQSDGPPRTSSIDGGLTGA